MRGHFLILPLHLLFAAVAFGQTTAFVGVDVVPMDRERVLLNQTVIVRGGIISQIGHARKVPIPTQATRIDGKGKFLMPGLVDSHIHLRQTNEKGLIQYLAAGVTTARDMNGRPSLLEWRRSINRGELLGPTLFVASPAIGSFSSPRDGYPTPRSVAEAESLIKRFVNEGYDWIKVYSFVPRDIFKAIMAAAAKHNIRVGGHPPLDISFDESLEMRSIEHLLGFLDPIMTPDAVELDKADLRAVFHAVDFDRSKLPELTGKMRNAGVWNCPTILFFDHRVPSEQVREAWDKPELRKLGHVNRVEITRQLHRSGARLLLCTDSDAGRNLPASSIYEEMRNMQAAELTPYQVLSAGTRDAAEFLGSRDFGLVGVGKRADLLLVECDPLKDLSCVEKLSGVMARGRWMTKSYLAALSELK